MRIRPEDTREHWVQLFHLYRRWAAMTRNSPGLHARYLGDMRQCRLVLDQLDG
jgi:hypothetical protein